MLRTFPSSFSSAIVCQVSSTGTSSGGQCNCRQSSTSVRRRSSDSSAALADRLRVADFLAAAEFVAFEAGPHLVRTVGRSSSCERGKSASPITVSAWPRP